MFTLRTPTGDPVTLSNLPSSWHGARPLTIDLQESLASDITDIATFHQGWKLDRSGPFPVIVGKTGDLRYNVNAADSCIPLLISRDEIILRIL